eukprot:5228715-Amphidinium_carterae.1
MAAQKDPSLLDHLLQQVHSLYQPFSEGTMQTDHSHAQRGTAAISLMLAALFGWHCYRLKQPKLEGVAQLCAPPSKALPKAPTTCL